MCLSWFQPCIFPFPFLLAESCTFKARSLPWTPFHSLNHLWCSGACRNYSACKCSLSWARIKLSGRNWEFPAMKTGLWLCIFSSFPAGNHSILSCLQNLPCHSVSNILHVLLWLLSKRSIIPERWLHPAILLKILYKNYPFSPRQFRPEF